MGRRSSTRTTPTSATTHGILGIGDDAVVRDRPARAARQERAPGTSSGTASRISTTSSSRRIAGEGGLAAIAISHPHYYAAMVEWAHAFGCPIHPARGRAEVGDAPRSRGPLLERRDARARRRADAHPLRRALRGRPGAALGRAARAALGRHRPGDPRPALRQLHVLVPEPDPAAAVEGRARSPRRSRPTRSTRSTARGGTA